MAKTTAIFLSFVAVVACFTTCAAQSSNNTSLSEIEALTAFKLSLHDPLGSLDGWDPSTPLAPCDWRGVLCFNNRVHELRLPRLQLTGQLAPASLSNLPDLRKLSLHSNNFNSTIPSSLSRCLFLRALYLHNNKFSGTVPPSLLNLTNLQILNLAHNLLSGTVPSHLSASLRFLDLSSNSFSGDIPANFSSKSQLQLINLSYNSFTGRIPATIGELQRLEYLWLDSNHLHGTLPSALANCTSLVHLSAVDNSIGGLIPSTIGTMPQLQVLSLSMNQLSGSVPTSLLCFAGSNNNNNYNSSLRIVQLGFNKLTGISMPPGGKCVSFLEFLDLKQNHIVGPLFSFTNVTSLRALDLYEKFNPLSQLVLSGK